MKENITTRVARLISGGLNAFLDKVENTAPETVMEEAIREIDSAIDEVRKELGRTVANKHLANTRLADENEKHEKLGEQIELAVKESRDDLAEAAIAKQLDIEAQIPILESTIAEAGSTEKELEGYISALRARKREMSEELSQYRASRQQASTANAPPDASTAAGGSDDIESKVHQAESAFDRVMSRATGVSGSMVSERGDAAKLAELDDMARQNRVNERLAQVKNRQNSD